MTAPRRQTYIPQQSDRSGRRAGLRLWRPLIIIGACIVILIVGLALAKVFGGVS